MRTHPELLDALVIGGGFYGAAIAIYLVRQRGLRRVALVEREPALLRRASYHNQARVHNGYHYPRCYTTAYRSRVNLPRFIGDWDAAIHRDFTKLYAIARRGSRLTARQFLRFAHEIGAEIEAAEPPLRALFDPQLIEDVFRVEEYAFDAVRLAALAEAALAECGVAVRLSARVSALYRAPGGGVLAMLQPASGGEEALSSRYVFNCTYSGLNQLRGEFPGTQTALKHEITEMALIEAPPVLRGLGITVMDGPFFSLMPFPARGLHTLSHVRYTPHLEWSDTPHTDPYRKLVQHGRNSRYDRMVRDAARYLPAIAAARQVDSLFEVKTVLQMNEADDGRPILFERHADLPGCYSVLGGKIDNIYDVLGRLDEEILTPAPRCETQKAGHG